MTGSPDGNEAGGRGDAGHHHHGPPPEGAPDRNAPLARGCGRDRVLFLDAFSGIAGDMVVAALVDLGVPREVIIDAVSALPLSGYELQFGKCRRSAIVAGRFETRIEKDQQSRDYATIRSMLESSEHLQDGARKMALVAFELLAGAEAEVHGTETERVRFHEVGAVDSIVDIVAASVAFDHIGARVICSPLPMGRGMVDTQHGVMPSPAPATVLCLRGIPTYDARTDAELVTPTGACLAAVAASEFSRWPSMMSERVGWGAGSRELPDRPNLLRAVLGSDSELRHSVGDDPGHEHVVIETNVDDMSGEIAALSLERAFEAGALDAWTTPIGMKKGRPALMISALARKPEVDAVARAILTETTSLGLRLRGVGRIERSRRIVEVETSYGMIPVKVADGDGLPLNVAPEYEACREAADAHEVPVKTVLQAAVSAYLAKTGNE